MVNKTQIIRRANSFEEFLTDCEHLAKYTHRAEKMWMHYASHVIEFCTGRNVY